MTMSGKWKDGYDAWKGPTSAEKGRAEDPRHPFPKNNYNLSNKSIAQARKDGQSEREREREEPQPYNVETLPERPKSHTHTQEIYTQEIYNQDSVSHCIFCWIAGRGQRGLGVNEE
jgi:hypothetical protein